MNNSVKSLFVALALLAASQVQAQAMHDCSLLVGSWDGEYVYENGSYSSWSARYFESGELGISFYDEQGNEVGSQTGLWQCDGVWVTSQVEENGEWFEYKYRIRNLSEQEYVYESVFGPVFTSVRAD